VNLVKRHFFTTIEKQKKIHSVTKNNDNPIFVEIAIFSQKAATYTEAAFFVISYPAGPHLSGMAMLLLSSGRQRYPCSLLRASFP
jgi:hypothetical protein